MKTTTLGISLIFIATCSASISLPIPRSTAYLDCDDIKPGQTESQKTPPEDFQAGVVRLYGSVQLSGAKGNAGKHGCSVVYKLFMSSNGKPFEMIKEFSDKDDFSFGVDIIGASNDGNMIAADFWWAAGDATGHRPVVVDVRSNSQATSFMRLL